MKTSKRMFYLLGAFAVCLCLAAGLLIKKNFFEKPFYDRTDEVLLAEMIDYETMIDELKARNELADASAYVENTDKNKQYFRIIQGQHQREDYLPTWEIYALMNMENGQPISFDRLEKVVINGQDYYDKSITKTFEGTLSIAVNEYSLELLSTGAISNEHETYRYTEHEEPLFPGDWVTVYFSKEPIEVVEGEVTYTKTGDYYFSAHKELAVEELSGK